MTNLPTVFDSPQFNLLPDPKERKYANVSNLLEIVGRSRTRFETVAIPSLLFTLMKTALNVSPQDQCSLAIDELTDSEPENPKFVLSLFVTGANEDRLYDLWMYSRGSMPQWLL